MEDITILELALQNSKDYGQYTLTRTELDAIENLINRVKELEKEKANYNHAKEIIDKYYDLTNKIYKEFIPKSIIREKIEELKEIKNTALTDRTVEMMNDKINILELILEDK